MATTKQYAKWCLDLIDGETHMMADILNAMLEDGYLDSNQEWIYKNEEDN